MNLVKYINILNNVEYINIILIDCLNIAQIWEYEVSLENQMQKLVKRMIK